MPHAAVSKPPSSFQRLSVILYEFRLIHLFSVKKSEQFFIPPVFSRRQYLAALCFLPVFSGATCDLRHIHTQTHAHIHTQTHAHIHTQKHAHIHTHIHAHIHVSSLKQPNIQFSELHKHLRIQAHREVTINKIDFLQSNCAYYSRVLSIGHSLQAPRSLQSTGLVIIVLILHRSMLC